MINNLLFCMCAMGSIVYVCYALLCLIFRYRFKPGQRLFMLLVSAAFYLLPLPLLRNFLKSCIYSSKMVQHLFPSVTEPKAVVFTQMKTFYKDEAGHLHFPVYSRLVLILAGIWLLFLVVLFAWQLIKFSKIRRQFIHNSQEISPDWLKYGNEITPKHRKKISVRVSPLCSSPFLIGFLRPVIFLPVDTNPEQLPHILKHETCHFQSLHNFIKITGFLVFAVHWYFPLTFCFYKSLDKTLELLCDEHVLKNSTEEERNCYVNLLLNLPIPSSDENICLPGYSSFQSLKFHITKERILMIKHGKTSKSVFSILLTTCSLLAGAVPIMAYDQPAFNASSLYASSDPRTNEAVEIWVPDGAEFPEEYDYLNLPDEPVFFDKGNDYFIADDGEIYYFSSDPESYAACKHTYKTGYSYKHLPHADMSCNYQKFQAKRCTKCGYVTSRTLISNNFYPKCPH